MGFDILINTSPLDPVYGASFESLSEIKCTLIIVLNLWGTK